MKRFWSGGDCIIRLMDLLLSWSAWCYAEKRKFKQSKMSTEGRMILMKTDQILCCLCGSSVERSKGVIHHCRLTGKVSKVAHSRLQSTNQDLAIPTYFLSQSFTIWCTPYNQIFETQQWWEAFSYCKDWWNLHFLFLGCTDGRIQEQVGLTCRTVSFFTFFRQLPIYVPKQTR